MVPFLNGTLDEKDYIRNLRSIQVTRVSNHNKRPAALGMASRLHLARHAQQHHERVYQQSAGSDCRQHISIA